MKKTQRYRVVVSQRAEGMLLEHLRFVAQVSIEAALALQREITSTLESLQSMPARYPFFEGELIPPNRYHKLYAGGYYLILYQVLGDTVEIAAVCDTRKQPWKPLGTG